MRIFSGMKRISTTETMLVVASIALAVLLASGVTLVVGTGPAQAAFPGKNGKIAFSLDGDIYVMRRDGTRIENLTKDMGRVNSPNWSANGKRIAFNSVPNVGSSDIYVMNANGTSRRNVTKTSTPSSEFGPAWSPSGTKIAFCGSRGDTGGYSDIYVMNADGTGRIKKLYGSNGDDCNPNWSPDGKKIAFSSSTNDAPYSSVLVMNADGMNVKNLTRDTSISGSDPNWSPNGRKIVFAAFLPSTVDIFVMQADGTLPRNLTKTPDKWEGQPAFSPDGRKIIYIRFGGVFKMNADGTEHQGLPTGRDAGVPDWQPLP